MDRAMTFQQGGERLKGRALEQETSGIGQLPSWGGEKDPTVLPVHEQGVKLMFKK